MSNINEFDVAESIGENLSGTDKLKKLHELADECVALERSIKDQESILSATKAALQMLKTRHMVELMIELKQSYFIFRDQEFDLSDYVSGSLPKEEPARSIAFNYLEELEADGLVKTDLSVLFGKSQHNEALDLYSQLQESGYPVTIETNIHSQTLQAFARRKIENGESIDWERLGLFVGKVVKTAQVDPKTGKRIRKQKVAEL